MRIVMLLGRSTGGIGTHVVQLTKGLRALGDEVVVVTDPVTVQRFSLGDAQLWWPSRAVGLRRSLASFLHLRGLLQGADVVHAHGHQAGLVATLAALGAGTPVVVSQHNAVLGTGSARSLVARLVQTVVARRAAVVTGASSDLVDEARRHGARKTWVAPVPSPRVPALLARDLAELSERRRAAAALLQQNGIDAPPGTALVLTIARIAPQKDLATLVEAARTLQTSARAAATPAVWVVVGGGDQPLKQDLEGRARSVGAPVHLVGEQPDPDEWLRAADVFVLTSLWEARALVVQEAMAAGVPVVTTDTGGLRELVEGVGSLVPVRDAEAVARAVGSYLDDPAARHTAVAVGRRRAASWGDDGATARRWREWYSDARRMT
jgi:glycosyltransferase involved in cell wall biosynthesis